MSPLVDLNAIGRKTLVPPLGIWFLHFYYLNRVRARTTHNLRKFQLATSYCCRNFTLWQNTYNGRTDSVALVIVSRWAWARNFGYGTLRTEISLKCNSYKENLLLLCGIRKKGHTEARSLWRQGDPVTHYLCWTSAMLPWDYMAKPKMSWIFISCFIVWAQLSVSD